jgi:hypothetical protein
MTCRRSAIVVVTLIAAVGSAAAQNAQPKPQTVTGCLQRTDAGTYVLANVDLRSVSVQSAGARAGGGGATTRLPVIGLIPPSVSLRNFVDQKVDVAAVVKDSPTQPGTLAIEIVDGSRLPPNTPPVKSTGSCK